MSKQATTDRGNRERRAALAAGSGLCQYCRPHGGCNRTRPRPRSDRGKSHRRPS